MYYLFTDRRIICIAIGFKRRYFDSEKTNRLDRYERLFREPLYDVCGIFFESLPPIIITLRTVADEKIISNIHRIREIFGTVSALLAGNKDEIRSRVVQRKLKSFSTLKSEFKGFRTRTAKFKEEIISRA